MVPLHQTHCQIWKPCENSGYASEEFITKWLLVQADFFLSMHPSHPITEGKKWSGHNMCLRGARSHQGCALSLGALDLALAEGQVATARATARATAH